MTATKAMGSLPSFSPTPAGQTQHGHGLQGQYVGEEITQKDAHLCKRAPGNGCHVTGHLSRLLGMVCSATLLLQAVVASSQMSCQGGTAALSTEQGDYMSLLSCCRVYNVVLSSLLDSVALLTSSTWGPMGVVALGCPLTTADRASSTADAAIAYFIFLLDVIHGGGSSRGGQQHG